MYTSTNFIFIPKTNHPTHLRENIQVFHFRLSNSDVQQLTEYDYQRQTRSGWDPTHNDWNEFDPIY